MVSWMGRLSGQATLNALCLGSRRSLIPSTGRGIASACQARQCARYFVPAWMPKLLGDTVGYWPTPWKATTPPSSLRKMTHLLIGSVVVVFFGWLAHGGHWSQVITGWLALWLYDILKGFGIDIQHPVPVAVVKIFNPGPEKLTAQTPPKIGRKKLPAKGKHLVSTAIFREASCYYFLIGWTHVCVCVRHVLILMGTVTMRKEGDYCSTIWYKTTKRIMQGGPLLVIDIIIGVITPIDGRK